MNLQQRMLAEMKAEMDARTEAIIAAADLCHEAEAIAEALTDAGLQAEAQGAYLPNIAPGNVVDIWVSCSATGLKACDILEAIFIADLVVRQAFSYPGSPASVWLKFADLDVALRVRLPDDEAEALVRAFKPRAVDPSLIGRSDLAAEVPA